MTARGVAHLVVHGTTGSTSYETIPPVRLESSGGLLSTVDMVVQRRDGPRRLRDHDDDDDDDVGTTRSVVRCVRATSTRRVERWAPSLPSGSHRYCSSVLSSYFRDSSQCFDYKPT